MGNCQLGWPVPDGLSHRRGWHFGQQAARVLVQLLTGVARSPLKLKLTFTVDHIHQMLDL